MKQKRKLISFILCMFLLASIIPLNTLATDIKATGTCGDNLAWTLTTGGTLTISGEGTMDDYDYDYEWDEPTAPWYSKINTMSDIRIIVEDGVTSIGAYAFYYCDNISEVVLSDSVESIGESAFHYCEGLKKLTLGKNTNYFGTNAFAGCYEIESIYTSDLENWCKKQFETAGASPLQGSGVYGVDTTLYFNNIAYTDIVIPESITEIPKYCFRRFTQMQSVELHEGITKIGDEAFEDCKLEEITIPNSVIELGNNIFYNCSLLSDVNLPENITAITQGMFRACTSLVTIDIPDTVKEIANAAFTDCTSLTSLEYPKSLEVLGSSAFQGCTSLKNAILPEGLEIIEHSVYRECSNLETVEVPNSVTSFGAMAFYNCKNLLAANIPEGITQLPNQLFSGCNKLNEIILPDTLTQLNNYALSGTAITSIDIPDNVTTLGDGVFSGCTNLEEIIIPESITSIGTSVFLRSSKISSVYWEGSMTQWLNFSFPDYTSNPCWAGANLYVGDEKVVDLSIDENVIEINPFAFYGCGSLTSITFPSTMKSIGEKSFSNCDLLKTLTFLGDAPVIAEDAFNYVTATSYYPEGNETYTEEIKESDFGGDLIWTYEGEIKEEDFYRCGENIIWSLNDDGVLTLSGSGVIYDYSVDDEVYAPWYEQRASIESIIIEDGITYIGESAFESCRAANGVSLADSVITIGKKAFKNCTFTSIELPDNLKTIGESAFESTQLTTIVIPEEVTTVEKGAFQNSKLTSVTLPDSLTYIPDNMFSGCFYLYTVNLQDTLVSIGNGSFAQCYALNSLVLPEGLISIGDYAFSTCGPSQLYAGYYDCNNFTSIELPSTLESIGTQAFWYCQSLSSIVIPDKVTTIEEYTFGNCNALNTAVISANIANINKDAFLNCKRLKTITFKWNAPQINSAAFNSNVTATCYYPSNNPSWTSSMFQNYGGILTWVGKEMEEPVDNIEITIEIPTNENANVSITTPEKGWVEGTNSFSVESDKKCVVLVSNDGGKTYTKLIAEESEAGNNYTVTDMTSDTVLAVLVLGDVNGDDEITNADMVKLKAYLLGKTELDVDMLYQADVNEDGEITNADLTKLKAVILGKTTL